MGTPRRRQAGFTLIEVTIVLAITLLIGAIVYKVTRASWLLYRTQTQVTERGFSGVRAVDDMAIEIMRAGYGLGDARPLVPKALDVVAPEFAGITLRSNPEGIVGIPQEDFVGPGQLVQVDGASLFAEGDEVLVMEDPEKNVERGRITRVGPESLGLRARDTPDGSFLRPFWSSKLARILKVREVGFYLKKDRDGVWVVARKAPGQAEQVLVRHVKTLQFEYLDERQNPIEPIKWRPGYAPSGVRITLELWPNPDLPPVMVPPLTVFVPLEPQSAAIPFDFAGHYTVGLAGVIGQDPTSAARTVRMHAWREGHRY